MARADFEDFVVLVTGASSGLGRAISVEVASRGAKVVVINYASNEDEAHQTAALVRQEGAEAVIVQGDVSIDEDCQRIVAAAAPYGRIDALFNNAGMTKMAPNHADLQAVNAEDFLRLYSVNVIGAFQMIRAAQSLLEAAPQPGAVVMTASIAGVTGMGSSVPYTASKGAMITMTISLARALAPKIRINAVCPGFIATPWFEKGLGAQAMEQMRQRVATTTPLKVASEAEDIAPVAVFLASPDSRHITGETLLVDGGVHLGGASLGMR